MTLEVLRSGLPWLSWEDVVRLREDLVQHGLPEDPKDVRVRLAEAVANAEGLRVLFGGQWDESSRQYVWDLVDEWRQGVRWREMSTHAGPSTRQ